MKKQFEILEKKGFYCRVIFCNNCLNYMTIRIKKGVKISEIIKQKPKCDYCGCEIESIWEFTEYVNDLEELENKI